MEGTHSRLDGDHGTLGQLAPDSQISEHTIFIRVVRVPARVVYIHAQIMSQAVREEGDTDSLRQYLLFVAFQYASLLQSLDSDAVRIDMHVFPPHARLQHLEATLLHLKHDIIDGLRLGREGAAERKGARYIGAVAIVFSARVEQEIQLTLEQLIVLDIVQCRGVGAARDDGMVCLLPASVGHTCRDEGGFELALILGVFPLGEDRSMR